jgi:predicted permease
MDTPVFSQVLVLFILMAIGFLSCKLGIAPKEASVYFSSFVLKISLPCLILTSFQRPFSRELLGEAGAALGIAFAVYALSFLLGWIYPRLLRIRGPERGVHRYAVIISNSGFIGYPVVEAILGPAYLFHASVFNVPVNLLAYSIGAWLVAKEGGKAPEFSWRVLVTPPMVFTVIGFLMFLFSLSLPGPLGRSVRLAGDMTTPLSMAVIGISIARADWGRMFGRWRIYVTVFMRLLLVPALVGLCCFLGGIRGPLLMLSVIITAMPAGSTTSIMASLYDVAPEEAGSIVALSTVLSAATIPLAVFAVHCLGG